jgi:hypothetical protein
VSTDPSQNNYLYYAFSWEERNLREREREREREGLSRVLKWLLFTHRLGHRSSEYTSTSFFKTHSYINGADKEED